MLRRLGGGPAGWLQRNGMILVCRTFVPVALGSSMTTSSLGAQELVAQLQLRYYKFDWRIVFFGGSSLENWYGMTSGSHNHSREIPGSWGTSVGCGRESRSLGFLSLRRCLISDEANKGRNRSSSFLTGRSRATLDGDARLSQRSSGVAVTAGN